MPVSRSTILFILCLIPSISFARTLGTFGAIYPIAERDAISEIEDRARKINWKRILTHLERKGAQFRPSDLRELPHAHKSRVRTIDMTYVLDVDVPDPEHPGTVLYPKGFSFNPLQYMTLPGNLVIFDATDRRQCEWLRSSPVVNTSTILLATSGSVDDMERLFNRPVYFAEGWLIDRLNIQATPSIARQQSGTLVVEEIDVHKTRHNR